MGLVDERHTFDDGRFVPQGTVLLLEQEQASVRGGARGPAGIGEEDQRQQTGHVGVSGKEGAQHPGEVERPLDEVGPDEVLPRRRPVTGREEQQQHRQHGVDAGRHLVRRRHTERDAGGGDLLLRPRDPGRHRRLGDEEGTGDLCRRQAAEEAQRQGDLGIRRERRVAACEDEPEPVIGGVAETRRAKPRSLLLLHEERQRAFERRLTPAEVEGSPLGHRREPGGWLGGHAGRPPGPQRLCVRILDALLSDIDVAGDAYRRGEHEAPLATVRLCHGGRDGRLRRLVVTGQSNSMTGRTSTPPKRAGTCLAMAIAASRSGASIT